MIEIWIKELIIVMTVSDIVSFRQNKFCCDLFDWRWLNLSRSNVKNKTENISHFGWEEQLKLSNLSSKLWTNPQAFSFFVAKKTEGFL